MPIADALLTRDGNVNAPLDYVVPSGARLVPVLISATFTDPTNAGPYIPCVEVVTPNGDVLGPFPLATQIAAGASARVSWFRSVGANFAIQAATSETLFLDTRNPSGVTSSIVLQSGVQYLITAQGDWSYINHALDVGAPDADALFPTPGGGRVSTQVGFDPETLYAYWSGQPPGQPIGHVTNFQINLGGGFVHVEPSDGQHTTPRANHTYTYEVTGQGSPVAFLFSDSPGQYGDNYGYVKITIQPLNATNVPSPGPSRALLRSDGTQGVWESQPDIAEADLNLADNTTANVSTTKHGLAPKAPNDATKFLNGVGAYSTPAGTVPLTTKGDLFGYDTAPNRIPVGANNTILIADSTQALGVKWGTPASVNPGLPLLFDSTLGVAAASIDTGAGGIASGHATLIIYIIIRSAQAANNDVALITFNNDAGANYDFEHLTAAGAGTTAAVVQANNALTCNVPAATDAANSAAQLELTVHAYDQTTFFKAGRMVSGYGNATEGNERTMGFNWRNTAAISRLKIALNSGANLVAGSRLTIYGTQ